LARVDHRDRDPQGGDASGDGALVPAGGLQDDQLLGARFLEASGEFVDALLIVGYEERLALRQQADFEARL
jgi:hypothetical protein